MPVELNDLLNRVTKDKMSVTDFDKISRSLSELLYLRTIYEEIKDNKITIQNKIAFKKLKKGKRILKRAKHSFTNFEEIKEIDYLAKINSKFLHSFKRKLFSNIIVSYDRNEMSHVIKGIYDLFLKVSMKLTPDQIHDVERDAGAFYNVGKRVGGDFAFDD